MKEFTVSMALVDFIPVVFFLIGAIMLQRDLYSKMSKGAFTLFAAGTIDVICAGGLKALYKLLYALGVCDFQPLSQMFFPVQSIGFLLAGIGIVALLVHPQGNTKLLAAAPVLWSGTMLFVSFMVLGLGCMDVGLMIMAKRIGKKAAIPVYIFSFICCLMMGYLSSRSFDKAALNWVAEGINVIGQGLFCLGAVMLHKGGLAEAEIKKA